MFITTPPPRRKTPIARTAMSYTPLLSTAAARAPVPASAGCAALRTLAAVGVPSPQAGPVQVAPPRGHGHARDPAHAAGTVGDDRVGVANGLALLFPAGRGRDRAPGPKPQR